MAVHIMNNIHDQVIVHWIENRNICKKILYDMFDEPFIPIKNLYMLEDIKIHGSACEYCKRFFYNENIPYQNIVYDTYCIYCPLYIVTGIKCSDANSVWNSVLLAKKGTKNILACELPSDAKYLIRTLLTAINKMVALLITVKRSLNNVHTKIDYNINTN
jgi:hypothetical protein